MGVAFTGAFGGASQFCVGVDCINIVDGAKNGICVSAGGTSEQAAKAAKSGSTGPVTVGNYTCTGRSAYTDGGSANYCIVSIE